MTRHTSLYSGTGTLASSLSILWLLVAPAQAQNAGFKPGEQGSRNIHVVAHVPLGRMFTVSDMEMEQELSRPYAYVARMHGVTHSSGFSIINLKEPSKSTVLYSYRIQEPDLHVGYGGMQNKYFKLRGRYYDVQSFQFAAGGPDADLGAIVFDVTGLPDTTTIKEVGRIRVPEALRAAFTMSTPISIPTAGS